MPAYMRFPEHTDAGRQYSVCFFDGGWIDPHVQFFEAENDERAVSEARVLRPWTTRELWHRHRLVRVLPALAQAVQTHELRS
jgi:hypothetical protein